MKITVYSTKTCPYCVMLKNWLDDKSVEHTNYNVDENPIAAQNMVNLSGQMGVPFSTVEYEDGHTSRKFLASIAHGLRLSLRDEAGELLSDKVPTPDYLTLS